MIVFKEGGRGTTTFAIPHLQASAIGSGAPRLGGKKRKGKGKTTLPRHAPLGVGAKGESGKSQPLIFLGRVGPVSTLFSVLQNSAVPGIKDLRADKHRQSAFNIY